MKRGRPAETPSEKGANAWALWSLVRQRLTDPNVRGVKRAADLVAEYLRANYPPAWHYKPSYIVRQFHTVESDIRRAVPNLKRHHRFLRFPNGERIPLFTDEVSFHRHHQLFSYKK